MKETISIRNWHIWVSIVLALPILIVGLTAVFIAHDTALKLKQVNIDPTWVPGVRLGGGGSDVRAVLALPDGTRYLGSKGGVVRVFNGAGESVAALSGVDTRSLVSQEKTIFAGTKMGVYRGDGAEWHKVLDGDVHGMGVASGTLWAAVKDRGLIVSHDGGESWALDEDTMGVLKTVPASAVGEPYNLSKLVMDLHTGKAFFGKAGEWIWIDVIGLAMVLLTLTGALMWWRSQKRRLDASGTDAATARRSASTVPNS